MEKYIKVFDVVRTGIPGETTLLVRTLDFGEVRNYISQIFTRVQKIARDNASMGLADASDAPQWEQNNRLIFSCRMDGIDCFYFVYPHLVSEADLQLREFSILEAQTKLDFKKNKK